MSASERLLRSLLAVIHEDGGVRVAVVGLEQATNEAIARVGRCLRKDATGDAVIEAAVNFVLARHAIVSAVEEFHRSTQE